MERGVTTPLGDAVQSSHRAWVLAHSVNGETKHPVTCMHMLSRLFLIAGQNGCCVEVSSPRPMLQHLNDLFVWHMVVQPQMCPSIRVLCDAHSDFGLQVHLQQECCWQRLTTERRSKQTSGPSEAFCWVSSSSPQAAAWTWPCCSSSGPLFWPSRQG